MEKDEYRFLGKITTLIACFFIILGIYELFYMNLGLTDLVKFSFVIGFVALGISLFFLYKGYTEVFEALARHDGNYPAMPPIPP